MGEQIDVDTVIDALSRDPKTTYVIQHGGEVVAVLVSPEYLEEIREGLAPPVTVDPPRFEERVWTSIGGPVSRSLRVDLEPNPLDIACPTCQSKAGEGCVLVARDGTRGVEPLRLRSFHSLRIEEASADIDVEPLAIIWARHTYNQEHHDSDNFTFAGARIPGDAWAELDQEERDRRARAVQRGINAARADGYTIRASETDGERARGAIVVIEPPQADA